MKNPPQKIAEKLIKIFPDFKKDWDDGESYGYENGDYSFHVIFMTFAPVAHKILSNSSATQINKFSTLINEMMENGGNEENAISTTLLEHASQIGIRKILQPYLTKEAKHKMR